MPSPDPLKPVPVVTADAQRQAIIRRRNLVVALVLAAFVALFFAISIVKIGNSPAKNLAKGLGGKASASTASAPAGNAP
jgi:hypothetical protein